MQSIRKSVRQLSVETPHVLLACSGGKDSVALAWLLADLQRLELLTFTIAHIHHGQHDRADRSADAVGEIGQLLDVPVIIHRLEQHRIDGHEGVGLEEAMRRERYLALSCLALNQNADCIALAHHQTDQAETILLHLMRGTGIDGLAGMQEWESRPIPWWGNATGANEPNETNLWRPLIRETVQEVAAIAARSELPIVEDPTNADPTYRRNAIRHQLLPVIEDIAAGSPAAIARSAEVVAADAQLLEEITGQKLQEIQTDGSLSRSRLSELPQALQNRVIRQWIIGNLPFLELSSDRVTAVVDVVARNRGGAVIEIGNGHRITLRNGRLFLD